MGDRDRAFEKLFGYALYNGLVIDRAWEECSLWGQHASRAWDPMLLDVLYTLAERWRVRITDASALKPMVTRYGRVPPEDSLRDAPEAFELLSDEQQELVVFAIQESILRWMTMERLADRSPVFRSTFHVIPSSGGARHASQVLFGMHCHTGDVGPMQAQQSFIALIDEMEKATHIAFSQSQAQAAAYDENEEYTEEGDEAADNDEDEFDGMSLIEADPHSSAASEGWQLLAAGAAHYDRAIRAGQRYLTVGLCFDQDAHTRADLDESLRRMVSAAVTSDSPDRFKYLWKAVIGEAARKLPWVPPEVARAPISQAPAEDPTLRRCVRVLSMVHELHKVGYQRLRVLPFLSSSGCYWRAWITSADNVAGDGYTLIDWEHEDGGRKVAKYTSGQGDGYFGWTDAAGLGARQLAQRFLERFPEICERSVGLDWAYAGWLTDVLGHAEQSGSGGALVYLIHDGEHAPEYMRRWQPPPPLRFEDHN